MHARLEEIAAALAAVVPPEPIEIRGSWSTATRGEIVDALWRGVAACAVPLAGIGFLRRAPSLYWVKSAPAAINPSIEIGLHAYANRPAERATFSAGLGSARLPGVPVRCGPDLAQSCALGTPRAATGRPHLVGEIDGAAFAVVFLPSALLQTGRKRLWRLREEFAASLPAEIRLLFTRGRTGELPVD